MTGSGARRGWKRADDLELVDLGDEIGGSLLAHALILVASALFSAAVVALAAWLTWLHWPAVVVLVLFALLSPLTVWDVLRVRAARSDTATSAVRAAPQGLVEIRATVEPIPGRELVSPLFGAACAYHRSIVTGRREGGLVSREVVVLRSGGRSILLDDGVAQVFVPGDANMVSEIDLAVQQTNINFPDEWRPLLDDPSVDLSRFASFEASEHLVPAGLTLQVNGEFRTLGGVDSYVVARATAMGLAPPSDEDREADPVELDWRAYCDHLAAVTGQSREMVRANAILPSRSGPAWLNLTAARDGRLRDTAQLSVSLLLMGVPPSLAIAWLLGLFGI